MSFFFLPKQRPTVITEFTFHFSEKFEQSTRGSLTAEGRGIGVGKQDPVCCEYELLHSLPLSMELSFEPNLWGREKGQTNDTSVLKIG